MPVQAKSGLAAMLLTDDLPASGVKANSRDDSDKTDFGAALGGLVAAMFAPAPSAPTTVKQNHADSAVDETNTIASGTNSHRATAAPVSSLTSNEINSPALAALFDYTFASNSAKPDGSSKGTSDSNAKAPNDPTAPPQAHATDQFVAPAPTSGSDSAPGLPQANRAATILPDVAATTTKSVPATAVDALAAGVSIKIEMTPAPAIEDRENLPSPTAPHDQHAGTAPATGAPTIAQVSFSTSAVAQTSASQPTPQDHGRGDNAASAPKSNGAEVSQSNTSAKETTRPVAQPVTTASLDTPVSAPIQVAARAASAYREASAAIASKKEEPTTRRSDQNVDAVGSPQTSTTSDPAAPKVAEAAQIRQILDSVGDVSTAHVANVKVDLADGQSAQAMVRERAGNVDVKIVAPGADSARHIAGEVDSLRGALEGAGLHLGHSEVSYQGSSGEHGRNRGDAERDSNQQARETSEIFSINEGNE